MSRHRSAVSGFIGLGLILTGALVTRQEDDNRFKVLWEFDAKG